jgi:hypothetical protein
MVAASQSQANTRKRQLAVAWYSHGLGMEDGNEHIPRMAGWKQGKP